MGKGARITYLGSSCNPFSSIESMALCRALRFSWPGGAAEGLPPGICPGYMPC